MGFQSTLHHYICITLSVYEFHRFAYIAMIGSSDFVIFLEYNGKFRLIDVFFCPDMTVSSINI